MADEWKITDPQFILPREAFLEKIDHLKDSRHGQLRRHDAALRELVKELADAVRDCELMMVHPYEPSEARDQRTALLARAKAVTQ